MHTYSLAHLSDAVLMRDLAALVARDRLTTAELLAHIAEVDARRLYVPAGYSSMHAYCVEELRLSEDAAYKRIRAARAARQFPAVFGALAEGRLHLTAVCLLASHLTPENTDELIEAASHRRKSEVEELLARRFLLPDLTAMVRVIPPNPVLPVSQLAPGPVGSEAPDHSRTYDEAFAPGSECGGTGTSGGSLALGQVGHNVAPPSPERFLLKLTIGTNTHHKLRHAQALLSHAVPSGDVAQVLDRALDALIQQLERRKFGAITRRRTNTNGQGSDPHPTNVRARYVPSHIRRAVSERDQGQCTFVSASGHRCKARRFLEFDHVDPVARGGRATVEGMRLRCRAHNQYEAERTFGADFMARKRQERRVAAERERGASAQARALAAKTRTAQLRAANARAREADAEAIQDVIAGPRSLGFRADEARRAAEFSLDLQGTTLEERMRAALMYLGRRSIQNCRAAGSHHAGLG